MMIRPAIDDPQRASPVPRVTCVAIVYATDFKKMSAGGIMTHLGELIPRLSTRFPVVFVGVGDPRQADAARQGTGGPAAVVSVLSPERKPEWLPLNVAFTIALFRRRKDICQSADVVHVHRMETGLPFVIRKTTPVLLTVHGSSKFHAMTDTGPLRWRVCKILYDLVEGFVFSRADRVILVSREAHEYYTKRHPRLRDKFVVIPNFIETSEFQRLDRATARAAYGLLEDDTAVVYAGRLVQEKRVDVLIEAFGLLLRERPSAHLFIAGEGPDHARLRREVAQRGVEHVHFVGLLPKSAVLNLLAAADVLALPSRFEGFPMVALEALACGVPVVASDVGGIRDIFDDNLVPFIWRSGDPRELKAKLGEAADRRVELRDRCITCAGNFETSRIIPRLEALYATLGSASSPP